MSVAFQPLTQNQLFDLVAPLSIYHAADLCYKRQARSAIGKLFNHWDDPIVIRYLGTAQTLEQWLEYMERREPEFLADCVSVYNDLFQEVVLDEKPGWQKYVDRWGAYGFKDSHGRHVFAGDGSFEY